MECTAKTETATARCESGSGRLIKSLESLFYAISLHAPTRKHEDNTNSRIPVASRFGACSSMKFLEVES